MPTENSPEELEQTATEQETSTEQSENASPEELGVGQRQSNEPFSPIDFDSIIEKAAAEVKKPDETQQPAEEVVQDAPKEEAKEEEKPASEEEKPTEEKTEEKPKQEEQKTEAAAAAKEEQKAAAEQTATDKEIEAIEKKMGPHSAPKTKQLFNEVKAIAAREKAEREKIQKELETLREQTKQQQAQQGKLPKEVEEEIAALRDKVRQFDATADPAIVAKYDKPIESNNDSIIKTLTDAGLPQEHAETLKKKGVTLANLKPYLNTLETGIGADGKQYQADPDTAERIRETLRENMRLAKDKEREITEWRGSYETRVKQQEEAQKQQLEQATARLNSEFETHLKRWDFLQKPADVTDADAPAIRKQKEAAIKEYNDKSLAYAEAVKKETASPLDAQVSARIGILYRDHVAPRLAAKLESANKEIAELQKQIDSMKKAGSATRTVGTVKPSGAPKKEVDMSKGFDDIIDEVAREAFGQQ